MTCCTICGEELFRRVPHTGQETRVARKCRCERSGDGPVVGDRRPREGHTFPESGRRTLCATCHSCGCDECFDSGKCRYCGRGMAEDRYEEVRTPAGWFQVDLMTDEQLASFGYKR